MTPFFSIIIPVYNVAPYLRECLDSVLAQTFTDWEAICVDDGSTDGSGTILDEYAAKDKRFRVIHQRNAGVSIARNCALDCARGEWIWFIDSDDRIKSCALQTFVNYEHKADITFFGMDFIYDDGSVKSFCHRKINLTQINENTAAIIVGLTKCKMGIDLFGYTVNKFIKREVISVNKICFERGITLWEDALFAMEYIRHAETFAVMPVILYEYRQIESGLTRRKTKPFLETGIVFERYADMASLMPFKEFAANRALACYRYALVGNQKWPAACALIQLYRNCGKLLNRQGGFIKLLSGCSHLPQWLGAMILCAVCQDR